jgi:tetratricopeptide (TPR) repeat protein
VREANFNKAKAVHAKDRDVTLPDTLQYELLAAYHRNDAAAIARYRQMMQKSIAEAGANRKDLWKSLDHSMAWDLLLSGDIDDGEKLSEAPVEAKYASELKDQVADQQAVVKLYRGRLREAAIKEKRVLGVHVPYFNWPPDTLRMKLDEVARRDTMPSKGTRPNDVLKRHFQLYRQAILNCQLGNTAEALQQAQRIESLSTPPYWADAVNALATDIRAFADIARGDHAQALKRIESIQNDVPLDLRWSPAGRREEMLWRGELLYRTGRYDEALQWFENVEHAFGDFTEVTPFYILRRAQIHDRKGEVDKAKALYAKFLGYWKDPDPELRPMVNEARNRLTQLMSKGA